MNTKLLPVFTKAFGLLLLVTAPVVGHAQLTYENVAGVGLIYDAADNIYWTQDADITGETFDSQDAQTWAANLSYAGIGAGNWQLPDGAEFTYMFDQLPATAGDDTDHFGPQENFGAGPNDYVSNVEPEYWTSTTGQTFNFFYGYTGAPDPADAVYSAWAVTTVPEPGEAGLGMLGLALAAGLKRRSTRRA